MALYRPSFGIGALSGSLGGAVARQGAAGPQLVNRSAKRKRTTVRGDRWRAAFVRAQRAWATLTTDQRLAWIAYARDFTAVNRVGLQRPRAAFQMFVQAYSLSLLITGTPPTPLDPPIGRIPPADSLSATASVSSGLDLDVNVSSPLVNPFGAWFAADSGRNYLPTTFPNYKFLVAQTLSGPFDYTSEWEALYGPLRQGRAISLQFVQHFGLAVPRAPLQIDLLVTA